MGEQHKISCILDRKKRVQKPENTLTLLSPRGPQGMLGLAEKKNGINQ